MQIAIDGPVGSGKSTVSNLVSKKLGIVYIDTGAMYRTVALNCLRKNIHLEDEQAVCQRAKENELSLEFLPAEEHDDGRNCTILLNGEDVSWAIREAEPTRGSAIVSQYKCVRTYLVRKQQEIAKGKDVIMEGRDIAYRVLPNADLKIYLTANEMVRALRTQAHLLEHGHNGGLALSEAEGLSKIRETIRARDQQDMGRALDPLQKVADAIEIDTSELTIDEVVDRVVELATRHAQS